MSESTLEKFCKLCEETKNINDFHKKHNICNKCHSNRNNQYYHNRKKEINENRRKKKDDKENNLKTQIIECRKCEISVSGDNFNFQYNTCKECQRKKHREYMQKRKQEEPLFKFIANYRTRVYKIFSDIDKNFSTKELLGEDLNFIKEWFDFCFSDEMNFGNQGSVWHVDHVIPISKFNAKDEDDVKNCFNWKNLCPLLKFDNISKKDNIMTLQINEHINKLKLFCERKIDKKDEVEDYITNIFLPYLINDQ